MAKIASVERIWVDLPLKEVPQRNMVREIPHWTLFELCKVTLDSGHVGVGETMPYYTTNEVGEESVARVEGANPFDGAFDKRFRGPVAGHAADLEEEIVHDVAALGGVMNLGMELQAVKAALIISNTRRFQRFGGPDYLESFGQLDNGIAV